MKQDTVVSEMFGEEAVLTPSDLCAKQFHRSAFGYHAREVDAYLARVADVLESLIRKVRDLKNLQEEYKTEIEEYRQIEATLRNALVTSQKFGENLIESAKREAETLVEAARIEKDRVLTEAAEIPSALAEEITRLQEQRDRLRRELLAILDTHRTLLESLPESRMDIPVAGTPRPMPATGARAEKESS